MPAASATSSTLTSSNPRAANRSIATELMWSQVVERRRPTRCWETGLMRLDPFPFRHPMPYSCDLDHIMSRPGSRKVHLMEPNQQAETEAELVTETLVEEVSIDGMCGVY